jgi:hypothetical protein
MLTRHVQRAGLLLGAILAALLFFLGGAALRLLMGPISLGPFTSVIEDALNHSISGVVVRFDQAVLEWSRAEGKVNLIVLGTKVFDTNGHIIAQAPKADLDFDAAAMVAGHLNLTRFGLIGVQLTGVRSKQGAIRLGFGPERGEPDLLETIRNILQNSAEGGGTLESFAIRNARLAFRDEPTGLFIVSPDTSFTLENKKDHLNASLESAVEISGVPARIAARAVLRADGTADNGTVDIKGLSFPALVQNSLNFAALKPYQIVSDVTASFSLNQNGDLVASAFHATGAGNIDTPILDSPLSLEKFDAQGSYDGEKIQLALDDFSFKGKQAAAGGKAALTLVLKEGALETLSGNVEASNVRLDFPRWFRQPFAFARFAVQGAYDVKNRKVTWQRAVIDGGALSADVSGTARFMDAGSPALTLTGTLNALPVSEALKYWPIDLGSGAHDWIAINIPEGRIGPTRIDADFAAGVLDEDSLPDGALTVTFPFEGLTARYIASMTPITGGHGEAKLTGDTFRVTVAAASVGPLAVTNGDVYIAHLNTHGALTRIKAHGEGTMAEVLRLIDEEPLGYPKRFGINPATVNGRAAVDLDFELPLLKDLSLDQVRIGVQAKAAGLGLLIDNRKFENGMVSFAIDSQSLASQGTATLSGVPITFKWTEDFGATGITTRVDLSGRLDDAARANLGLSDPKWLTGSMPVTLALSGTRFHFTDAALRADLTNALADIPMLNLTKRMGVRSNATAQLRFGDAGALSINDLVVTGEGLNVRGALSLGGDGRIINVSLAEVRSGVNDFAMTMVPINGEGFAMRFQGKSLDASHFFADKKAAPNGQPPAEMDSELQQPFSLDARIDRLVFRENLGFRDVTLAVSFAANQKLTRFSLDAMGTGKGKVTGRMEMVKGMRNLSLDTDDAGAFIDTFMGFGSVRGGTLAARITFPSDAPDAKSPPDYQGTIMLSNVVITDQPFVARLFSAGSLDGPLRLLQGEGISLTSVSIPFNARGKLVTIHEGRAAGPAIGATFGGMLDRKAEKVDVTGTLVPVYGLNSILGAVPVLGDILISKKGEGVFGLTYAMKGNLNEPNLTVNPLSVLTPGIFRRIFEFNPPKEAPPQAQPQASVESAPAPAPVPATPE